jgi:hypothetical protein
VNKMMLSIAGLDSCLSSSEMFCDNSSPVQDFISSNGTAKKRNKLVSDSFWRSVSPMMTILDIVEIDILELQFGLDRKSENKYLHRCNWLCHFRFFQRKFNNESTPFVQLTGCADRTLHNIDKTLTNAQSKPHSSIPRI